MSEGAWDSTTVEPLGDGRYRAVIGPEWVLAMAAMSPPWGTIASTHSGPITAR